MPSGQRTNIDQVVWRHVASQDLNELITKYVAHVLFIVAYNIVGKK